MSSLCRDFLRGASERSRGATRSRTLCRSWAVHRAGGHPAVGSMRSHAQTSRRGSRFRKSFPIRCPTAHGNASSHASVSLCQQGRSRRMHWRSRPGVFNPIEELLIGSRLTGRDPRPGSHRNGRSPTDSVVTNWMDRRVPHWDSSQLWRQQFASAVHSDPLISVRSRGSESVERPFEQDLDQRLVWDTPTLGLFTRSL